jgi:hypothetical protein
VIQIATAGVNEFECSPAPRIAQPMRCEIVQVSSTGENSARCYERSDEGSTADQHCTVEQTNTAGTNRVHVEQTVQQQVKPPQRAAQQARVTQTNGAGDSVSEIQQAVAQQLGRASGGTQRQDADQRAVVEQHSTTGANQSLVGQSLAEDATSSAALVRQMQIASDIDPKTPMNTSAQIEQSSREGANTSQLTQTHRLFSSVRGARTATQTQGSRLGGLSTTVRQLSSGISRSEVRQAERHALVAKQTGVLRGTVTQTQSGPVYCCSTQGTNPRSRVDLDQISDLTASSPGARQSTKVTGRCKTAGICSVHQLVVIDGVQTTPKCGPQECVTTARGRRS